MNRHVSHLHRSRHRVGDEAGAEFLEKGDLLADGGFRRGKTGAGGIQAGDDALLFGERGDGKPCLANCALADIGL